MDFNNLINILNTMMAYMEEHNLPESLPDVEGMDKTHISGIINQTTADLHPKFVELANGLDSLADSLLITPDGRPAFHIHNQLQYHTSGKYYVTPGEVDSFGWLSGIINTPKGKYVYG